MMKHRTITKTHLISLIDGRKYKQLKRHIQAHGLTCDEYRTKYGLPEDYPMVHPSEINARKIASRKRSKVRT